MIIFSKYVIFLLRSKTKEDLASLTPGHLSLLKFIIQVHVQGIYSYFKTVIMYFIMHACLKARMQNLVYHIFVMMNLLKLKSLILYGETSLPQETTFIK